MLNILTGTYYHTLDAKGRMSFPTKLREILGDDFIVTKGIDRKCLTVYSPEEWKKLSDKILELPETKATVIKRWLFAGAYEAVPDKSGRILIPKELRNFAGLEKDTVVVGADNKAEIWSKEAWEEYNASFNTDELLSLMESIGF